MKITKTSLEVKMEQDQYKEAHDGCEKCPCCKEADVIARKMELENDLANHKAMKYYMADSLVILGSHVYELCDDGSIGDCVGSNRFVKQLRSEEYTKHGVRYRIDKYRCRICGSEWESDPYEVETLNMPTADYSGEDPGWGLKIFYLVFLVLLPILATIYVLVS